VKFAAIPLQEMSAAQVEAVVASLDKGAYIKAFAAAFDPRDGAALSGLTEPQFVGNMVDEGVKKANAQRLYNKLKQGATALRCALCLDWC